jgi:menaquinone-9 beta-reductase
MPGVEAYITPGGPNIVGVTFLVSQEYLRKYFDGKQLFEFLLKRFPVIEERLRGIRPEDEPESTGPMQQTAVSPVANGVLLVGDAAGYLDAITGEGISLALAQSMALEKTVLPVLKNRIDSGSPILAQDLMPYAQAYQALVKSNNRMTRLVLLLARYPHLNDKAIAVLKRYPKLFQLLVSYNMS